MKKINTLFLGTACAVSLTSLASAATLASYNYDADGDFSATTLAPNISSTNTVLAGGSNRGVSGAGNHVFIQNAGAALTDGSLSFTIATVGTTDLIDLNNFSFNDASGADVTKTYQAFVGGVAAGAAQTATGMAGAPLYTVDLSSFAPANSYDIQLRLTSPGTDIGTNTLRLDNVTIDGALVPEPSSAALLGLGGLALIMRRRK